MLKNTYAEQNKTVAPFVYHLTRTRKEMGHKGSLSSAFNMSLGFIPVILSILLCGLITQEKALCTGTAAGMAGLWLSHRRKGTRAPNFILRIVTGVLALLTVLLPVSGGHIPDRLFPAVLEAAVLLPMLSLYLLKKKFTARFLRQKSPCHRHLYAQGAEAAVVSARIAILAGLLHAAAIGIAVVLGNPPDPAVRSLLFETLPPVLFLTIILSNQVAICFFNRLMSRTEYVPVVNLKGEVIGKAPAMEAMHYKNGRIHPVIRIALSIHGRLFLTARPPTAVLDRNRTDIPLEDYIRFGESLSDGVKRLICHAFPPPAEEIKPEFNIAYHFENEVTNRLVYLYIADIKDESSLRTACIRHCKPWSFKQIEENLGKGFFSACFENEYGHLKDIIYIKEKYKGF